MWLYIKALIFFTSLWVFPIAI